MATREKRLDVTSLPDLGKGNPLSSHLWSIFFSGSVSFRDTASALLNFTVTVRRAGALPAGGVGLTPILETLNITLTTL
ncbi:hypothetical protein GSI_09597 [Ganoderma sinense ZZ0214-1]|uniref:Uncharacterized protein n=1 Tax=Ganoderma sinense ZZ0214-1 TaxID=1077348 RepID=A0A2G8S419_9APHY|nr:hypothetical protein GSI_09597 [Ganoderma sinense ZZ0214-1]